VNHLSKVLGLVLVTLVLAGCTSSPDSTSGSDPDQSSPEASASTSVQETPDEEPTPTIPPATGETIKVKGMKVNLPAGWVAGRLGVIEAYGRPRSEVGSGLTLFRFPQLLVESLDEQARDNASRSDWDNKLKRLEDVTVDGQIVTHLSGKTRPGEYVDLFSTLLDREQLELEFNFGNGESKAVREEIVQSVLASWQFTG
jgi:hypothetical protein